MMELIITVALVSVFFGAVALTLPKTLETYIMEKRIARGVEMTQIIENGIASELSAASSISIATMDVEGTSYTYLSYVSNVVSGNGVRISEQHWFPVNYKDSDVTITYSTDNSNHNTSSWQKLDDGTPLVFTQGAQCISVKGKPQVFNFVIDDDFYQDMQAEVTLYYNGPERLMSMKVQIYDDMGSVCTSEKAIILYN